MTRHPPTEGNDLKPKRVDAEEQVTTPDGQGGRKSLTDAVTNLTINKFSNSFTLDANDNAEKGNSGIPEGQIVGLWIDQGSRGNLSNISASTSGVLYAQPSYDGSRVAVIYRNDTNQTIDVTVRARFLEY